MHLPKLLWYSPIIIVTIPYHIQQIIWLTHLITLSNIDKWSVQCYVHRNAFDPLSVHLLNNTPANTHSTTTGNYVGILLQKWTWPNTYTLSLISAMAYIKTFCQTSIYEHRTYFFSAHNRNTLMMSSDDLHHDVDTSVHSFFKMNVDKTPMKNKTQWYSWYLIHKLFFQI